MKYTKQIPAVLLGLVFFVLGGLFYFLKLMKMPDLNPNEATFMNLFESTGYMKFIKVLELVVGILLLVPKTRALGLILIAPIVVGIAAYDFLIHGGVGLGLGLLILNAFGIYLNREKYMSIIS